MQCEMCGSDEQLFKTNIEGSILNVCKTCSKFGKVISTVKPPEQVKKEEKQQRKHVARAAEPEVVYVITPDFAKRIKKKRESLGLEQKKFAKLINEKDSIVSKLETGAFEPNIKLARKLEKFLHIKLVEEYREEQKAALVKAKKGVTIGDVVKLKKR